jgi:hypothetical protein
MRFSKALMFGKVLSHLWESMHGPVFVFPMRTKERNEGCFLSIAPPPSLNADSMNI